MSNVIKVAGTANKASAIIGALNGGHIDSLATDQRAARLVLQMAYSAPERKDFLSAT